MISSTAVECGKQVADIIAPLIQLAISGSTTKGELIEKRLTAAILSEDWATMAAIGQVIHFMDSLQAKVTYTKLMSSISPNAENIKPDHIKVHKLADVSLKIIHTYITVAKLEAFTAPNSGQVISKAEIEDEMKRRGIT